MKIPKASNDYMKNSKLQLDFNECLELFEKGAILLNADFSISGHDGFKEVLLDNKKLLARIKQLLGVIDIFTDHMLEAAERLETLN